MSTESTVIRFVTDANESGRADQVLARRYPTVGRRALAALFQSGSVRVNGRPAAKGDTVAPGSVFELSRKPRATEDFVVRAQNLGELGLLYEDEALVAISKPPGVASHPLEPHELNTAANRIVAKFPECAHASETSREGGLVHRLDTGTSGILIAARSRAAWKSVRQQFQARQIAKTYIAVVENSIADTGHCRAHLRHSGKRMVALDYSTEASLEASTEWDVLERGHVVAMVRARAITGRRHQVRVHLAHVGAPIVGDTDYGGRAIDMIGHFLHAETIQLTSPATEHVMELVAPLPPERERLWESLRASKPVDTGDRDY